MVSLEQLKTKLAVEYKCLSDLNLYDAPECVSLATQAAKGRHLRVLSNQDSNSIQVCLLEDNYPGWLRVADLNFLEEATTHYQAIALTETEIQAKLPAVITFTHNAMQQPNYYLWGGTVAPNYDCSGLMQAAFASEGIWLPRDSYQQQAFTQKITLEELQPGDLIFFGTPEKVNHVALYLGEGRYIHSSGQEMGRNGIGIDCLSAEGDQISRGYFHRLKGAGRVVASYQPSHFS